MKENYRWIDKRWIEDLIWCPSQCYRRIEAGGKLYTLYLRWRWDNPWQFRVMDGDAVERKTEFLPWTVDIFEKLGLWFADNDFKKAEEKAEELFLSLWAEGKLSDYWEAEDA